MKTDILGDFQICISVPLTYFGSSISDTQLESEKIEKIP